MPDLIHDMERGEDSQQHLSENKSKFESDATFLLKQMMRGDRLTAKTVVQKYSMESRRLRDLFISGKCEKAWKVNEQGKRLYVEYFITTPKPPSKKQTIENWKQLTQQNLFP